MRILYSLIAAAAVLVFAAPHPAAAQDFKPYVGLDYTRIAVDYSSDRILLPEDSFDGFNLHGGARIGRNLGLELGYMRSSASDNSYTAQSDTSVTSSGGGSVTVPRGATLRNSNVKMNGFSFDGFGYLPVGDGPAELIFTGGILRASVEADISVTAGDGSRAGGAKYDETDSLFRLGAGAQFNINDRFSVRGLVRYYPQGAFKDAVGEAVDNAWDFNLGVNFSF